MSNDYETLRIDTPENVAFDYKMAGIGSRFLAALVDTVLIVILQAVVYLPLILFVSTAPNEAGTSASDSGLVIIFGLISLAFFWGYYIFFEMLWGGQSPGKRWVGLRVIRTDGTPIGLSESLIRNVVRLLDFMPIAYGFGVMAMFISDQSRRLGDLAAGTLVVHDRAPITLKSLAVHNRAPGSSQSFAVHRAVTLKMNPSLFTLAEGLPVEHLSAHDLQLVEQFLERREELKNRPGLAAKILGSLYDRMGLPNPDISPQFIEDVLSVIVEEAHRRSSA
jgi:uncharacterized RDD family membrane protein YckC